MGGGGVQVIYKHYAILYKGLEHPQLLVSKGDTEGWLYTSHPGLLPASARVSRRCSCG